MSKAAELFGKLEWLDGWWIPGVDRGPFRMPRFGGFGGTGGNTRAYFVYNNNNNSTQANQYNK